VADWQTSDGTLRVRLLEPASAEASFVVQGERKSPPSELGDVIASRESPSMIAFRLRPLGGTDPRGLTVSVVRDTPQAVLVANVEEARYRLLAAEDGQLLVEARYAIRNNQRSFLKVSLPDGATVWSAEVGGVPTRPGVAEQNAILLPLDKGRAGQEAPTFVVELVYLQRSSAWPEKGSASIALPALDLPTSRTGLRLHFPPRFRVELRPGTFRPRAAGRRAVSRVRSVDLSRRRAHRRGAAAGGRSRGTQGSGLAGEV
jgi:hypothetical protein